MNAVSATLKKYLKDTHHYPIQEINVLKKSIFILLKLNYSYNSSQSCDIHIWHTRLYEKQRSDTSKKIINEAILKLVAL